MAIRVSCPKCGSVLNAPDAAAGKKGRCPKCKTVLAVPPAGTAKEAKQQKEPAPSRPPVRDRGPAAKPRPTPRDPQSAAKPQPPVRDPQPAAKPQPTAAKAEPAVPVEPSGKRKPRVAILLGAVAVVILAGAGVFLSGSFRGAGNPAVPAGRSRRASDTSSRPGGQEPAQVPRATQMDRGAQVIRMLKQGTPTQDELNAALRRLILQGEGDCTDKEAEAARMLAARGADVDSLRWGREMGTALHHRMSFFSGRRRVRAPAELLLALGIDVNARDTEGQTPLHYAVREQHIRAGRDFSDDVKLLLDRGADVNAKDKSGVTALHLACRAGDDAVAAEFIDLLIARGADVNAEDAQGCTPLYAVGGPQKAKVLIEHGADVSAANSHGFTALFITRDLEVAQLLIERGADVKGRSTTGGTPLHICRSPEITQLLIDRGAEVNARDDFGETPLAVAERLLKTAPGDTVAARRQIVTILRKHGATK